MKNIFITLIILISFIKIVSSEDVTMKYGGDWVNTTVIQNDNFMMLQTFDVIQEAVPLLKIDMLSAIKISVDYVDADGD